jgi:hypothetical protein
MSVQLKPELRAALRAAAWPVARDIRGREQKWSGASTGTIGPRVTVAGAAVTQRARKVTGKRPDFGRLQMLDAFIPALEAHETEIVTAAEGVLETIYSVGGFE